jgi:hypothetical protein
MIASDKELELHLLIKGNNDLALSKLYDLYGESIVVCLKKWFKNIATKDEALILEAVNEAFWGYYKNPNTFDPNLNSLQRFLEIAADRDLRNILQREKKYLNRQQLPENVELQEKFWNSVKKDDHSTDEYIIQQQSLALVDKELASYFTTEQDRTLAKLILLEEKDTNVFSDVLKIQSLPIGEQRKEIKRNKDRIKKVLERNHVRSKLKSFLQ